MTTTTVMTLSEYAPDAVLCTVRLYAGLVEETITLGYRPVKIDHHTVVILYRRHSDRPTSSAFRWAE